jgi:ribosomal protein S1
MDRRRGNIVVSRRAILEETRAEQRSGLIQSLAEGQVIDGVVKNITDYGAFVDLGGNRRPAARHRHQLQARQPPVEVLTSATR